MLLSGTTLGELLIWTGARAKGRGSMRVMKSETEAVSFHRVL